MPLPVGLPSTNFTYNLEVHVSNARGATVISNTMPVQVPLPTEEEISLLLGNLSSTLDTLIDTGDTRGVLNLVHRVSSILNANTPNGQMKETATEARRTMARQVQVVAGQLQTLAGYRKLGSVLAALAEVGDQMTADLQTDIVKMMVDVVAYLSSQPKEALGPHRLEEASASVFKVVWTFPVAAFSLSSSLFTVSSASRAL
ncbi:hypothetical protein Bbelb_201050 [Branchiostoma belcheri]|nr:hypothetical protein Bbelb_201050 [Branchiostoma belcheri]